MRIEQLMTQPAITCELEGTLDGAARLMWDHDCGDVIVRMEGNWGSSGHLPASAHRALEARSRRERSAARPREVSAPPTA